MANIRVDSPIPVYEGQVITFKSPVDISQVSGLVVYYPDGNKTVSKEFQFADAHGNNVGDLNLFAANVVVKVILDTAANMAFVQNADTNAYLEGELAKKYSPTNKPTAADVGAVNKAGDTMTGVLYLKPVGSAGYSQVYKNVVSGTDYGTLIIDRDANGKIMGLKLDAYRGLSRIVEGGNEYNILHTDNKPSGSYTGNGSSAARTVNVGGIGRVLYLEAYEVLGIVGPQGAVMFNTYSKTMELFPADSCKYVDGVLTIATADSAINYNGATYNYQVL